MLFCWRGGFRGGKSINTYKKGGWVENEGLVSTGRGREGTVGRSKTTAENEPHTDRMMMNDR